MFSQSACLLLLLASSASVVSGAWKPICECALHIQINSELPSRTKLLYKPFDVEQPTRPKQTDICDNDCAMRCLEEAENQLSDPDIQDVCELFRDVTKRSSIVQRGIDVLVEFKHRETQDPPNGTPDFECSQDLFVLYSNLCCGYCDCLVRGVDQATGQIVSYGSQLLENLYDLSDNNYRLFNCEADDAMQHCEKECRKNLKYMMNPDDEKKDDPTSDLNPPYELYKVRDEICSDGKAPIRSPGHDVYFHIDMDTRSKDIYLGNICCMRPCECKLLYKDLKSVVNSGQDVTSVPYKELADLDTSDATVGAIYECSNELIYCMDACRMAAAKYLNNAALASKDLGMLHDLNVMKDFCSARNVCKKVFDLEKLKSLQFYLYLSYSTVDSNSNKNAASEFPKQETLLLGHLCCENPSTFGAYYPLKNCKSWPVATNQTCSI